MGSRSGNIFTIVAPSGAGKTTLVRALLSLEPALQLSISYTTRAPRAGEEEGKAYHFVSRATFEEMINAGELLEYAEVHGNLYGTSRMWLERTLQSSRDILLEIDWQGAAQVRTMFAQTIGIFILPPSLSVLEQRLRARGTDEEAVITRRLDAAKTEIEHIDEFNYVVINNQFDNAVNDLLAIVRAARLTRQQQTSCIEQVLNQ